LGIASIYSDRQTVSGEIMDAGKMTAAHRTLPFGTQVTVVNRSNGRSGWCASTIADHSCAAG
jgi:rare lipoprotein A